ncbi:MAG TPA: hypothetical protein VGV39_08380 [Mesorhizobium sp.]|jgi:hypothetical protein|uniref:hypothetical protein n=1 Tax=Mesorhizobium sp. TaxID=1871066 RepID=UPI002DDD69FF|nr:hypothetical protein [Mesorhizobium sp.]HEV2503080.1 hypothetical protein [Mesorhizobium sp.]
MRALIAGATGMFLLVGPGAAEPQYDRVLEQAAIDIVAANIGTLRGGFAYNQRPQMIVVQEAPPPRRALADGLVPAVERPSASQLF